VSCGLLLPSNVIASNVFLCILAVLVITFIVVLCLVDSLQTYLAHTTVVLALALLPSAVVWIATRLWGILLAHDLRLVFPVRCDV